MNNIFDDMARLRLDIHELAEWVIENCFEFLTHVSQWCIVTASQPIGCVGAVSPPASQWVPMGANGCQRVRMIANGCQWVLLCANGCQRVPMTADGSCDDKRAMIETKRPDETRAMITIGEAWRAVASRPSWSMKLPGPNPMASHGWPWGLDQEGS